MKKKNLGVALLTFLSLLISGCFSGGDTSSQSDSSSSDTSSSDSSSSDTSTTDTSTTDTSVTPDPTGNVTLKIFATNDIHGQVDEENIEATNGRMGIAKMMTYLKNQKEGHEEVFLLDQGDTWQGSIYSNYNYGALLNDVMSYVRYDARTIGNHDFDWGLEPLKANTAREYDGYLMPTLAANVYDYNFDTKTAGNTQQSDIGLTSIIRTLSNGLKVGVVGCIGKDQITSINSLYTHDITFKDHIAIAKAEAAKLKQAGCQVTILSIHTGQENVINKGLSDYFNLVLCGHTHRTEYTVEGDMPIFQYGEYTSHIGEIEISYDATSKKVTTRKDYVAYDSAYINEQVDTIDPKIQSLIDKYKSECDTQANEVLVQKAYGSFNEYSNAPRLMSKAIYDTAIKEGYDIDFACVNQARHSLGKSSQNTSWTYKDIYEAFPFDNEVYIVELTLDELSNRVFNSTFAKASGNFNITIGAKYKVAILDYLAFHTNSSRYYDYFPSVKDYKISELPKLSKNYRLILRDWLKDNHYNDSSHDLTLRYSDYSTSVTYFSQNEIIYPNVTLTFNYNYQGAPEPFYVNNEAKYHNIYNSAYPTSNPTRTGYGFDGWYLDSACTDAADNKTIDGDKTLYAKWKDPNIYSSQYFNFNIMANNGFLPLASDSGSFDATITNTFADEKTATISYNGAWIDDSVRNVRLDTHGTFLLRAPTGMKITTVKLMQWKYYNVRFFNGNSTNPSDDLNIAHETTTYLGNDANYYQFSGSYDYITIYNSYTDTIRLYYFQVDFTLVN